MDAKEYDRLRDKLQLTMADLAHELGISERVAWYYNSGKRRIPESVAKLLRLLVKHGLD
jgi:DNA-binding transcriptional regulator YiaG